MNEQELEQLFKELKSQGYRGSKQTLGNLIARAQAKTEQAVLLSWWKSSGLVKQHNALAAAFSHAEKRGLDAFLYSYPDRASIVFSSTAGYPGVALGRLEVSKAAIQWSFYRGDQRLKTLEKKVA